MVSRRGWRARSDFISHFTLCLVKINMHYRQLALVVLLQLSQVRHAGAGRLELRHGEDLATNIQDGHEVGIV